MSVTSVSKAIQFNSVNNDHTLSVDLYNGRITFSAFSKVSKGAPVAKALFTLSAIDRVISILQTALNNRKMQPVTLKGLWSDNGVSKVGWLIRITRDEEEVICMSIASTEEFFSNPITFKLIPFDLRIQLNDFDSLPDTKASEFGTESMIKTLNSLREASLYAPPAPSKNGNGYGNQHTHSGNNASSNNFPSYSTGDDAPF